MALHPVPQPTPSSFEGVIGTRYVAMDDERIVGDLVLRAELLDRDGFAPLGLFATLSEGAASLATAVAVRERGMVAAGLSNDTTRLAGISTGSLTIVGTRRHRTQDLWVWEIDCRGPDDVLCSVSTVRVAVRPRRG